MREGRMFAVAPTSRFAPSPKPLERAARRPGCGVPPRPATVEREEAAAARRDAARRLAARSRRQRGGRGAHLSYELWEAGRRLHQNTKPSKALQTGGCHAILPYPATSPSADHDGRRTEMAAAAAAAVDAVCSTARARTRARRVPAPSLWRRSSGKVRGAATPARVNQVPPARIVPMPIGVSSRDAPRCDSREPHALGIGCDRHC
eukprot:364366-Chlamydomonas_euryale.AAC.4